MKNYGKLLHDVNEKIHETEEICAICGGYIELRAFKGKKVCRKCVLGTR